MRSDLGNHPIAELGYGGNVATGLVVVLQRLAQQDDHAVDGIVGHHLTVPDVFE